MSQPPPFEEAAQCNGCKKAFGVFKRRHHCRNCGKSFCGDCQTKSLPLPHFNISEPARVCDGCNETLTNPKKANPASPAAAKPAAAAAPASPTAAASAQVSTPASRAAATAAADTKTASAQPAPASASAAPASVKAKRVAHCKCGLPFCICPEDAPAKDEKATPQNAPAPTKPAAKATASSAAASSSSASANASTSLFMKPKQSGFSGFGSSSSTQWDMRGDLNEQCREAIKANDLAGVTALLKAGASATYRDRTGATLLHLAAMFDRAQMVELLVKAGADTMAKNAQGETPIDLAPPALAAKISAKKFA